MAKRKPSRFDPYTSQAQTQGQLRYGGQERALEALLGGLVDDLSTTTRSQTGAARGIENAVAAERPQLQGAIGRAQATPGLSAQGSARLAETLANAEAELGQRSVGAREGAKYAIDRAVSDYRKESGKLKTEMTAVAQEKGLFMEDLFGQLVEADRGARRDARSERAKLEFTAGENALDRAQQQVNSLIGQGIDPNTGGLLPGQEDEAEKTKPKWVSAEKQEQVGSEISKAVAQAKRLKKEGRERGEAARTLTEGRPGQKVLDPKTGQEVNVPGVPSFRELYASIGLDLAFDGHISRRNAALLHKNRVKVRPLGYQTYTDLPASERRRGRNAPADRPQSSNPAAGA